MYRSLFSGSPFYRHLALPLGYGMNEVIFQWSGLGLGEAFSGAKLSPLKLVFGLSSLQFIPLTHFLKRRSSFGADAEYSFY